VVCLHQPASLQSPVLVLILSRYTAVASAAPESHLSFGRLLCVCRTSDVYKDTVPDEVLGLLAELIKCRACRILTNNTWQWGTNWLHKTGLHVTEEQLTEQMQAMCEITVSNRHHASLTCRQSSDSSFALSVRRTGVVISPSPTQTKKPACLLSKSPFREHHTGQTHA